MNAGPPVGYQQSMKTAVLTGVLAAGLVAAGCAGHGTGSTADSGPGGSPPGTTAAGGKCQTSQLAAEVRPHGAAAGNRYATLVLRNTSEQMCSLRGYGGIQLADSARRPIVTQQERDPQHPPQPVAVAPGDTASTLLHWGVVPGENEPDDRPCQPEPAYLLVIPPDETTQLAAAWPGGPVCQQGRIDQWAYAPGIVEPG